VTTNDQDDPIERSLRRLFDMAAAKSLAVINQDDAEPEMARFLHLVREHEERRSFVVRLFTDSFGDAFYLKREPWEFLQFCMHALRWPEVRDFIIARKQADLTRRGARSSTIWNDILAAFEPGWKGAAEFCEYTPRDSQVALRH